MLHNDDPLLQATRQVLALAEQTMAASAPDTRRHMLALLYSLNAPLSQNIFLEAVQQAYPPIVERYCRERQLSNKKDRVDYAHCLNLVVQAGQLTWHKKDKTNDYIWVFCFLLEEAKRELFSFTEEQAIQILKSLAEQNKQDTTLYYHFYEMLDTCWREMAEKNESQFRTMKARVFKHSLPDEQTITEFDSRQPFEKKIKLIKPLIRFADDAVVARLFSELSGEIGQGKDNVMLTRACESVFSSLIRDEPFRRRDVDRLFQYGMSKNDQFLSEPDRTPLVDACIVGNLPVVSYLIEIGADVNLAVAQGMSPLAMAAYYGHQAVVGALIKLPGIKLNIEDWHQTPIDMMAYARGHRDIARLIREAAQHCQPPSPYALYARLYSPKKPETPLHSPGKEKHVVFNT